MKKALLFTTVIFLVMLITLQSGCRNDRQLLDAPCDTAHTFKLAIMPILNTNCRVSGCHLGNNPPNGVSFDSYSQVKSQLVLINNIPKLLGVIRHDQGFDPMPQGRPMLDNCSIAKVKLWIDAGAPDN